MKPAISNVNPEVFDISSNTIDVYLPHHEIVTIRERNGEDEGILSRMEDFQSGIAIPKFLAAIIEGPKKYTAQEIQAWPIRSKYYLMYKERMWQYGPLVNWEQPFEFQGTEFKVPYEENIDWFDRDLAKGQEVEKKGQIIAYPKDKKNITFTTASGKNTRMEFLTGAAEVMLMESKPVGELNINDRFKIRNFELQDKNGVWHKLQMFNMLSAKDMTELRNHLEVADPEFNLNVTVKNPKSQETSQVSLMQLIDFFFQ